VPHSFDVALVNLTPIRNTSSYAFRCASYFRGLVIQIKN